MRPLPAAPELELSGEWYWVFDEVAGYVPGRQVAAEGDKRTMEVGNSTRVVRADQLGPAITSHRELTDTFDDMVKMEEVNVATI
jgi:hypothetical protein